MRPPVGMVASNLFPALRSLALSAFVFGLPLPALGY